MEKGKDKKSIKIKQLAECRDFGIALRSSGILLPQTEIEISLFKEIYQQQVKRELPERFKNLNFLFEKKHSIPTVILNIKEIDNNSVYSYAARDGQDLPENILNKMKELKKAKRAKKKK